MDEASKMKTKKGEGEGLFRDDFFSLTTRSITRTQKKKQVVV